MKTKPKRSKRLTSAQMQARLANRPPSWVVLLNTKLNRLSFPSVTQGAGNVKLVRGVWNDEFIRVLENFPVGRHDDEADALSLAHEELSGAQLGAPPRRIGIPRYDDYRISSSYRRGQILI
jgi:hypothetical protein